MMLELQKCIFKYQGSINKIVIDDKGLICIAVFGLPPLLHDDDPRRAVAAGVMIADTLGDSLGGGVAAHVGISSGRTFCGVIGAQTRCEYTVMGDMVNLSARLMSTAGKLGHDVLVDENTYKSSRDNFGYTTLTPVKMKGKADPIKIFTPTEDKENVDTKEEMGNVGRRKERIQLRNMVGTLSAFTRGGVLLITGEIGSGHDALTGTLTQISGEAGMAFLQRQSKSSRRTMKEVNKNGPKKHDSVGEQIISRKSSIISRMGSVAGGELADLRNTANAIESELMEGGVEFSVSHKGN